MARPYTPPTCSRLDVLQVLVPCDGRGLVGVVHDGGVTWADRYGMAQVPLASGVVVTVHCDGVQPEVVTWQPDAADVLA